MTESPEYIAATNAVYGALDAAQAKMRAAQAANDKSAWEAAKARYELAQDELARIEREGGFV